ncbi:MAG: biopolymer transporter Tol [Bacteroidota bacterium]|nr:biopolymer transporter Tol [Bacteroidota bacterium]MDP4241831.1 biopolymer transporter Tol [Bacteroidota bacterium]MDP4288380.1 biopolymer transporter Tol [Bacteroidota bacterium]
MLWIRPAAAQVGTSFGKNKVEYKHFDWHYLQSPHFDIYFYQGGRELAEFAADHAEMALDSIERVMKYDITNRIAILIYNSHNDFQQTNAVGEFLPEGVGGVTELLKNRVVLPFEGDFELFRHVIHHELTHAVVNDMFVGGTYQSLLTGGGMEIPSWMNEGLAEYNSLHGLDIETDMYMRDAVLNDAVPPLTRLGGYVQYRVGQTMYWYIDQRYGPDKVGELLQRIKTSRSVEAGFRSTFGMTIPEFGDKFLEGLKVLYYPDIARYADPNDYAETLADHKKLDDFMNVSPEISPQGDLVAFISDRSGYYDVYVQSLTQPSSIKKILNGGGASANFEELHLLTPGLSWSPDARRLALASKAGETDAIFLLDVNGENQQRLPNIDLDGIQGLKWSPDGKYIAVIGIKDGQSDLYLYDIEHKQLRNLTDDVFADHEPTWTADSKSIYFTSERENNLVSGQYPIQRTAGVNFESPNREIYRYDMATNAIVRITTTPNANEYYPALTQDNHLFYISDANGINNIYLANADGSNAHPITNSVSKIDQISISNDGTKLCFSTMHKGGYDLFTLRNPIDRHIDTLGLTEYRKNNGGRLVSRIDTSLKAGNQPDSAKGYGNVGVDLHDYVFSQNPAEERGTHGTRDHRAPASVVTNFKDSTGHYIVHEYKTVFSPDVIIGSAGYTGYYGLQGTTQMLFSDELGNQQIFFATNLILDLRNSDYILAYYNLSNRINWGLQGYHSAAFLQETSDPDAPNEILPIARFTSTGLAGMASYPLNRFTRFDFSVTGALFQKDLIVSENVPTKNAYAIFPQVNYVHDDALYSYFYPIGGTRFNFGIAAAPQFGSDWLGFVTPTMDLRRYLKITSTFSLATRVAGAASFGPTPQHFFIGGVDNWINRFYKTQGFPINSPQDFAFFTPGLPLRGFAYDERIGTHYAMANIELRYPFPISVAGFPLAFFGDSFIDAGTAWNNQVYLFQRAGDGSWITRDLLMSAGTGIRTYLLGFYTHFDIAWTTNLASWSHPNYIISLGEDF